MALPDLSRTYLVHSLPSSKIAGSFSCKRRLWLLACLWCSWRRATPSLRPLICLTCYWNYKLLVFSGQTGGRPQPPIGQGRGSTQGRVGHHLRRSLQRQRGGRCLQNARLRWKRGKGLQRVQGLQRFRSRLDPTESGRRLFRIWSEHWELQGEWRPPVITYLNWSN